MKRNKAEEEQKMWVELFRTAFVAQPNKQQSAMENRATTPTLDKYGEDKLLIHGVYRSIVIRLQLPIQNLQ